MLRVLVHYFVIGGVLFGAKTLYQGYRVEGPEITVRVPQSAGRAQVERTIEEAILLNEARRYGWDRRDPVVFSHLVRNMRFIEPDSTEDDLVLYQRALEMNMHRHDPIVRARLLYRAREALGYVPEDQMPNREELEAHRTEHADRFRRAGKIRIQHVFLSRSKRGDSLHGDARAMRDRLAAIGTGAPRGFGDPLPGLRAEQLTTPSRIRAEYGGELAKVVEEEIIGAWRGPIPSVYGLHFIRVLESEPPSVPPLEVIGAEVREDRLREIRETLRKDRMAALRDAYSVRIERSP